MHNVKKTSHWRDGVMFWTMFCRETLDLGIHMNLMCANYLNVVADKDFLAGLFGNSDNTGSEPLSWSTTLQSNPGEYVWGQGGYNAVNTQLLGLLENADLLHNEKEMISSLPTVHVSSEQVASQMKCPVCREQYTPGELVRQLPYVHCFHTDCIVPWLQLHGTCPVCGKNLNGDGNPLPQPVAQEPSSGTAELYETQKI